TICLAGLAPAWRANTASSTSRRAMVTPGARSRRGSARQSGGERRPGVASQRPIGAHIRGSVGLIAVAPYCCSLVSRQVPGPPKEQETILQRYDTTAYESLDEHGEFLWRLLDIFGPGAPGENARRGGR